MEENTEEVEELENKEENPITNNQQPTTELEEMTDRFKRVMADYENYKKRNEKEKEMLYKNLVSDIISGLLPVIDNLEKAVEAKTEDEGYKQGVELVQKQFLEVLRTFGVEEIKSVGETFDPELHEAVSSVVDESLGEKEIKEEFRKGYKIGPKIIRHAMVVVAN